MMFMSLPKGDVVPLNPGSTPVDFAYRIHTVGNHCAGARVNGRMVTLDTPEEWGYCRNNDPKAAIQVWTG